MEHVFHVSTKHFIVALNIPSLKKTKRQIHGGSSKLTQAEDEDEFNEDYDVDTSMDIEASTEDSDAILDTLVVDFTAGDTLGKVLAFVNQIRLCGEDTQKYLTILCVNDGYQPLKIKLWVQTHWGSVADCFGHVLELHKASTIKHLSLH